MEVRSLVPAVRARGKLTGEIAVKAITAAQLAMASQNVYSVTLDEAIEAMRLTASDMSVKYKETSLSVSACHTPYYPLFRPCFAFDAAADSRRLLQGLAVSFTLTAGSVVVLKCSLRAEDREDSADRACVLRVERQV